MKYLIDSNLWIYYFSPSAPLHQQAKEFIENLDLDINNYYVTTQILMEIYAVLTSNKLPEPHKPTDVIKRLKELVKSPIEVIGLTVKSMIHLEKLLLEHQPKGQKAWDYQLVAVMLENQIYNIYTNNVKDFEQINEIKAINPIN